jgi:hypothetical protein
METLEHLKRTTKFLCSLPLDTAIIRPFYYERGGLLRTKAVKEGKISEEEWLVRADVKRQLGLLPLDVVDDEIRTAYRRFYVRPSYALGQVYRALQQHDIVRLRDTLRVATSSQVKNILS